MNLRRILLPGLLSLLVLGLLAGCSRGTLYTFEMDLLALTDPAAREATVSVEPVYIPDESGAASSEIGLPAEAYGDLLSFAAHAEVALELVEGAATERLTLALHLTAGASSDPFVAAPVASSTATLTTGESAVLTFDARIDESENAQALAILRSGDFRVGLRLMPEDGTVASRVHYELLAADFAVTSGADLF